MVEGPSQRLNISELFRFVTATALAILLMTLAWEVVERNRLFGSSTETLRYVRHASTAIVAALVVYALALSARREQASTLIATAQESELQREQAERLLAVVMEASPAAVMVVDSARNLKAANQVACELHGDLTIGAACLASVARCQVCTGCETLNSGESLVASREMTEPNTGAVFSISSHPLTLADGSRAAVLIEEIVTQQQKLRASLVHQEKMAAFGMVAAGVAHEMGNPLSAIEMHLQLLDASALPEEDAESIETLRREAARLRRTLRELVDFARRRRTEASSVSVGSVFRDALQLLRYDPRMRKVKTTIEAGPEIPAVRIVEDHLMQVIVNLLINAIDAMPDGGELRIDIRHVGEQVAIRVLDTGAGMPKAVRERCFEPLFTTKEAGKGTGLGLSICRDVLEAVGGTIEVHSVPKRGTTVVVTLPQDVSDGVADEPILADEPVAAVARSRGSSLPRSTERGSV